MQPVSERKLRRAARQGTAWTAAAAWVEQLFRIAVLVVLIRLLPVSSFGLFALAASFTSIVLVVAGQGLTAATVQMPELTEVHLDTAWWSGMTGALIAAGGTVTVVGVLRGVTGIDLELLAVVAVLALKHPLAVSGQVPQAILRRELRFEALARTRMAAQAAAGVAALVMAATGFGVWSLAGRFLVESAVSSAGMWTAVSWRPRFRWTRNAYRQLMVMGAGITGVQLLKVARLRLGEMIIGFGCGMEALGYFSVAWRLLDSLGSLFRRPVGEVAWAMLARVQMEEDRLRRTILERLGLLYLISLPVLAAVMMVAAPVVEVVAGGRWRPMAPLMVALAVAAAWELLEGLTLSAITARGLVGLRVLLDAIVAGTALAGLASALGHGVVPMAWGYTAGVALGTAATQAVVLSHLPVGLGDLLRGVLPGALTASAVAVVMAVAWYLVGPGAGALAELAVVGGAGAVVTVAAWVWRLRGPLGKWPEG
ncbi:MAG: oligosaccharide flippase family protein [Acidobacteria bacterium]|nr:oligosaccharide flippase family protein [Acidobacteriota bacterium]